MDFCTGNRGVKILYDSFFKHVLNSEVCPKRLSLFLSSVLKKKMKIISVLPNDATRIMDGGSFIIMDILVQLEDDSLANIEVQKIPYNFPGERIDCYCQTANYNRVQQQIKIPSDTYQTARSCL